MPDEAPAAELAAAVKLHDQLEAEGMSHDEIVAVCGAAFGLSLAMLPPAAQSVHIIAHLHALGMILGHSKPNEHGRSVHAAPGAKIDAMWAWICTEPDGGEGVIGGTPANAPQMITPFVGADRARIEDYRGSVMTVAARTGWPIKLVRFGRPEIMERLGGKPLN